MNGTRNYFQGPAKGQPLTGRETEVMKLICDGKTMKEVATVLGVSVKTIEKQSQAIHVKWGCQRNIDILRYAVLHDHYVIRQWEGNPT